MKNNLDFQLDVDQFKSEKFFHKILVGGGPPNCSPRVTAAYSKPAFTPICKGFYLLIDEIQHMLRYVFQTTNKATMGMQSSGTGAIEASMLNVADPGEKVLIANAGFWGSRLVQIANHANFNVVEIKTKSGTAFSLETLEKEIIKHKPVLLYVVHGETANGVLQKLDGLGEICHKHDCLLGVDAIISLGAVPFFVDRWKIDIAVSSSNKAMRAPPGISYLTFSSKAVDRIRQCKTKPPLYYDILSLGGVWNCFETRTIYHNTFTAQNLFAAREGILEILEQGLEATWEHTREINRKFRLDLEKMGCKLFLEDESIWLPTINLFLLPSKINAQELVDYASKKYKIEFSLGIGEADYLRVGLMGYNARAEVVDRVLNVLSECIIHFQNKKL